MEKCASSIGHVTAALSSILGELASMLARYRLEGHACNAIHLIPDIIVMHDCIWGAVDLLGSSAPPDTLSATLLKQLYRGKRTDSSGMVTVEGLAEIVEVLAERLEAAAGNDAVRVAASTTPKS